MKTVQQLATEMFIKNPDAVGNNFNRIAFTGKQLIAVAKAYHKQFADIKKAKKLKKQKAQSEMAAMLTNKPKTFIVSSSNGELVANAGTGEVIECTVCRGGEGQYIENIAKFDVAEWCRTYPGEYLEGNTIDILDLGDWDKDGKYTPPEEDWREEYRLAKRIDIPDSDTRDMLTTNPKTL